MVNLNFLLPQLQDWLTIPLHPTTSLHILHTDLYIFAKELTRRIRLTIKSPFSWWSFFLFSWVTEGSFCKEKLDANYFLIR